MTIRNGRTGVLLAAVALLGAAEVRAQAGRACTVDGREGHVVADLGFSFGCVGSCSISFDQGRGDASFSQAPLVREPRSGLGVREGDRIVKVDGRATTSREGARRLVAVAPGERVRLTIEREGRERDVVLEAGSRCMAPPRAPRAPRPPRAGVDPEPELPGRPVFPDQPRVPPAPPAPAAPRVAPAPAVPQVPGAPGVAPAPPAPPAPPPPPAVLPEGWFGFGVRCSDCDFHTHVDERSGARTGSARFGAAPEVWSVEPGSPAARAGMRNGDRLIAIDGTDLTTTGGARRFLAVEPGETVTWTFVRDGRRMTARTRAERRPDARAPAAPGAPRAPEAAAAGRLRFSGSVGNAAVEVRGAPVTVSRDPRTGETVIRSADLTVRIRPEEP